METARSTDSTRLLIKRPPQFKVGFMSNDPPLYDVVPTVKEAVRMWWHGSSAR